MRSPPGHVWDEGEVVMTLLHDGMMATGDGQSRWLCQTAKAGRCCSATFHTGGASVWSLSGGGVLYRR